ncbi:AraC family transcriptional regulator [Pelagicoccus sp. SDUM812005]|uniref:AraC family transcriptional regulator n=1 Tax=Pelagicoccus sp. SDUM812005 TaxID=3041257 RepID=UPI00280FED2E|nr:AraC family transcriptional regulator [Pelagicoccus sp. SDUM812005]MDQ8183566.1 AraC family transcriptional regulator [Pelagicoccus sp. SDUM812005]
MASEIERGVEDIQNLGTSRYSVVRCDDSDPREWLAGTPVCSLLKQRHIAHVGVLRATYPFEIKRKFQSGSFMMACLEGEGTVLVDGQWKRLRAGEACLLPPFVLNTFKCIEGVSWEFCWVRYLESPETKPIVTHHSPVLGKYDCSPLFAAIQGLYSECRGMNNPAALDQWIELVQHYVMRFAQPQDYDDRLWRTWQKVDQSLSRKWTLSELAGIAHMSEEHLRRLCRQHYGRSPMQHLTFLRMQRAKQLLSTTDEKIESVARAVSYDSVYTFSSLFKRWVGYSPSQFR